MTVTRGATTTLNREETDRLRELAERQLPPLAPSGVGMVSLRTLLARRIAPQSPIDPPSTTPDGPPSSARSLGTTPYW